ncbi:scavenger receptor cysteine-rich type 1 protein M130-like [Osmerus eperlanus]|uniref:scavenger receptor cysteine-rich type 1 protein M130-like n=1 Tax=Osmerus eperlanus TaxID=29151 RepID=UPI002E1473CA
MACIGEYWGDTTNPCQCPLCKNRFSIKPELKVNTFISEMVDQFRRSATAEGSRNHHPARPGEVSCDVCTKAKLKALKSCLECQTSYCETHLEPHQRVAGLKRHQLVDPEENLEDRMCREHQMMHPEENLEDRSTPQSEVFYSPVETQSEREMVPVLMLVVMFWSTESVRLVEGAGLCSGRVEVRSDQSWVSVCEADFDRLDAEVVCRELGCGAPSALQGALYGEGKGPLWDKEFQCGGTESSLLDCDTSDSARNTCSPGNAVGLTCSGPDDVRLEGGAPSALQGALYGEGKGPLWDKEFQCGGNESRLLACDTSDSARNTCSPGNAVGLTCSGPDDVRLEGGDGRCVGRVEMKHQGQWRRVTRDWNWNWNRTLDKNLSSAAV